MSLSDHSLDAGNAGRPPQGWPSRWTIVSEPLRAAREVSSLPRRLPGLLKAAPKGDGRPVLTLPGYGGADGSMWLTREFLRRLNYRCYGLALGRNLDKGADRIRSVDDALKFREKMVAAICARVEALYQQHGEPVTLVGWSLGGVYAVDVAQALPQKVRQVITLGAPFGDPRGTTLFNLMRRLSRSTVPLDCQNYAGWCNRARLGKDVPPISVVFSDRDGIVSTTVAALENDAKVRYHCVQASHVGFSWNARALELVAQELCQV